MLQRLISAAILVPLVAAVFLLGEPWLTLLIATIAGLAAFETARLIKLAGLDASPGLAVALAFGGVLALAWTTAEFVLAYAALVVILAAIAGLFRQPRDGFLLWTGTALAALYPMLLGFVAAFRSVDHELPWPPSALGLDSARLWVLVLVATVWSLDSGAYLVGRSFPRGRFMNHLSPKKTWSGAIGGTVIGVTVCVWLLTTMGESLFLGLVFGVLITVFAQLGDLAESLLKRAAQQKDSGTLIPGHGGILDRVDSFLFAGPAMFGLLALMEAIRFTFFRVI